VALSGGVGGARLVDGLAALLPAPSLTVVVNTGDDFDHWGLRVCPDLDTVMYTLAGVVDPSRGWGLADESFRTLERMKSIGGADWFLLGDRDLATHLRRTEALAGGQSLTEVTATLCAAQGVTQRVLPMSDRPCATLVETESEGTLGFQDWFVRRRAAPTVRAVHSPADTPAPAALLAALESCDLVILGPSNPYVSIEPILARPGVRERVMARPVVALSPIVGGRAVKGPLAEMIGSIRGEPADAGAIVRHYGVRSEGGLLSGVVVERGDEGTVRGLPVRACQTVMGGRDDRARLASVMLEFAETLR